METLFDDGLLIMKNHSAERQRNALEMLRAGSDIATVHNETGYSYPHIRSLASAEGISLAKRNVGPKLLEVIGCLRRGLSNADTARETALSAERVRQIRNAALMAGALLSEDFE